MLEILILLSPLLFTSFICNLYLKSGVVATFYWWLKMDKGFDEHIKPFIGFIIAFVIFSMSFISTLQMVALKFSHESHDVIYLGDKEENISYFVDKKNYLSDKRIVLEDFPISNRSFKPIYRSTPVINNKSNINSYIPAYLMSFDEFSESLLTTLILLPIYLIIMAMCGNAVINFKEEYLKKESIVPQKKKGRKKKGKNNRVNDEVLKSKIKDEEVLALEVENKRIDKYLSFFYVYLIFIVLLILQQLIMDDSQPVIGERVIPLPTSIKTSAKIEATPIGIRKVIRIEAIRKVSAAGAGNATTVYKRVDTGYNEVTFLFEEGFTIPVYVSAAYKRSEHPKRHAYINNKICSKNKMTVEVIKNLKLRIIPLAEDNSN